MFGFKYRGQVVDLALQLANERQEREEIQGRLIQANLLAAKRASEFCEYKRQSHAINRTLEGEVSALRTQVSAQAAMLEKKASASQAEQDRKALARELLLQGYDGQKALEQAAIIYPVPV